MPLNNMKLFGVIQVSLCDCITWPHAAGQQVSNQGLACALPVEIIFVGFSENIWGMYPDFLVVRKHPSHSS